MKVVKIGNNEEKIVPITTNPIFTQKLKDYTPSCSIKCAIIFLIVSSALFITFGIAVIIESGKIIVISQDYEPRSNSTDKIVEIILDITEDLTENTYLYYGIDNFYSNHREFFNSKSWDQLRNKVDSGNYSKCEGAWSMGQMLDYNKSHPDWNKFNTSALAYPCGLMPKAYFQDTFELYKCSNSNDAQCIESTKIGINETNIANKYDREYAFIMNSTGKENDYWTDITNGKYTLF